MRGGVLPSGWGQEALRPRFTDLDEDECRALLATHGVGRVAVTTSAGPSIVPVSYLVTGDDIAYRTAPGATSAEAVGHEVAFEVDNVDESFRWGWSVQVVGPARPGGEAESARLTAEAPGRPWVDGERDMWVLVRADRVTGHRVHTD
nr:pyridoxamine 5'-phosphate oxidase family protein [Streptomyces taklimakanensis]